MSQSNSESNSAPKRRREVVTTGELVSNLKSFLKTQDKYTFKKLYKSPAACLAIYRMLPPLARHLIMNTLFVDEVLPLETFFTGIEPAYHGKSKQALKKMLKMYIFDSLKDTSGEANGEKGVVLLKINSSFSAQLQIALCGSGDESITALNFGIPNLIPDKYKTSIDELDIYAEQKRENILHFMVGSISEKKPTSRVIQLLEFSGLMAKSVTEGNAMKITNRGFQFLLKDSSSQVWILLIQYLSIVQRERNDPVEVLKFYFFLGSLELGCDYSMETLSEFQRSVVADLQDFGIIYRRKPGSRRFYPTRLATTLLSGNVSSNSEGIESKRRKTLDSNSEASGIDSSLANPKEEQTGEIVIETNYRVYAYTTSRLQIAILHLFISLKARFANMVEGYLDRDSVRRALSHGITAEQIIKYLEAHAHPQMRKQTPILPITVVDQIRLWEMEKDRVRSVPGRLLNDFTKARDFEVILRQARAHKVLLWVNVAKRIMVVKSQGFKEFSEVMKQVLRQPQ